MAFSTISLRLTRLVTDAGKVRDARILNVQTDEVRAAFHDSPVDDMSAAHRAFGAVSGTCADASIGGGAAELQARGTIGV